jgi:hypothetical protein
MVALATPPKAVATFKVYPTILDVRRSPGRAALGAFNVRLDSEGARRFRVVSQDIQQQPDGTLSYAPPSDSPYSAASWVSVGPRGFAGGPDRTQPLQYRVQVPAGAAPGDHLASLTVQRLPRRDSAVAAPIEAVSVRLTIHVPGHVRANAEISSLELPSIADGGPVEISATVRNTGNVTLDLDGKDRGGVTILDGNDREATIPLEGTIFPGQARAFDLSWDGPPLFGHFAAKASVKVGTQVAERTEKFWVIPWRQIAALVLIVLAALTLSLGIRRRRSGY